jgi:hypothetical protein
MRLPARSASPAGGTSGALARQSGLGSAKRAEPSYSTAIPFVRSLHLQTIRKVRSCLIDGEVVCVVTSTE